MKMPASGGDPVSTTLRLAFSPGSKVGDLEGGIEASAKRVLLTRIEYEPAINYQSSVLNTLKSKYIVVNTKPMLNNTKTVNGTNVNTKKSNNITLPVPKLTLFPPERVQLGYRGNLSVGSGMSNMGNTCYLNSTLQALFHVPALVNWLVSETAHQNCVQNSDFQMHPDDITCSVIKTFKCSQQKTGNCMKPISVYSKLKAICKHLNHGSQEDAHEFMRYLLESLEKNYLTRFQGHKLDSTSKETTPINQIFGGYIRTEVVCLSCRAVSTTFQHFQDLPLDIRKASTLNDALAGYFERERLPDGEDAYKCEKCNKKVSVTKKFTIEKPPNVLCVQLKRFSMTNGKISKQVQLPQYLDITRFISPNVQPRHPVKYRLVSMVTHMGQSVNCGHYTAIALAANGFYYQFDDSSVRQIPLNTVLNMSAYLILYEIERPFQAVNPRPFAAPSTVVWNGNSNNGEDEEAWPQVEMPTVSNSDATNSVCESKRGGIDSQSRMVYQLNKHGKAYAPPVYPTREQPTSNHQLHTKKGNKISVDSNSKRSSLVPYESDVSTDSDVENKDRSELEKLLTKLSSSSSTCSSSSSQSSSAKGWKVTELDDSVGSSAKACTTNWDITEVKTAKMVRNLSDTELDGRKKKRLRASGSDSEIDKTSSTKLEDKKKRTSILEKYKTNFGKRVEVNGGSGERESEDKTPKHPKKEKDKMSSDDVYSVFEPKEEKTPSKSLQFNRPVASNEINGFVGRTKTEENDRVVHGNGTDRTERGGDFRSKDGGDSSVCEKIERNLERKRDIVSTLLQNSHWGYGSSTVKSWTGTPSALEREVEDEKCESSKRTFDDMYNEDFDRGKVKKMKTNGDRDRPRYNLFQKKQQKYQDKINHYHWRNGNGSNGRYSHDYRNQYKRQPFNSQFNGNNNWNYSKKNYKFFSVPRSNRKGLGVRKYFRSIPGKIPGPKKNQSSGYLSTADIIETKFYFLCDSSKPRYELSSATKFNLNWLKLGLEKNYICKDFKKSFRMAEFDLTAKIGQYLDRHLVFPLLEFLSAKGIYDKKELLQVKLDILNKTNMLDYAIDIRRLLNPTEGPEALKARRNNVVQTLQELQNEASVIVGILSNDDDDTMKQMESMRDSKTLITYLQSQFDFKLEMMDTMYKLAKYRYECGNYSITKCYLYFYMLVMPTTDKNFLNVMWGKLASEILVQNWDTALEDLNKLRDFIDGNNFSSLQLLQQRTWLIHWSLFVFFNHPKGRDNIIDMFLYRAHYLNAIQTMCPHILRYLATAVVINRSRRSSLKDLVKVIQQESYTYRDPITEFIEHLYVNFDFDGARQKLHECHTVLFNDFFLIACLEEFVENARLMIFETFCRIHQCISIGMLAEKLNMNPDEAECWIVNLIRNARLDAKIDSKLGHVVMGTQPASPYQQLVEKIDSLSVRSEALLNLIERKVKAKQESRWGAQDFY